MSRLLTVLLLAAFALAGAEGAPAEAGEAPSYEAAERAYRAGELEAAERLLEARLELEPDDLDARLLRGFVRYRQGDDAGAERLFRDLLADLPESPDLFYGLALASRNLGQEEAAARYAERARALAPQRADLEGLARALNPAGEPLSPYTRPDRLQRPFMVEDGYFRHASGEASGEIIVVRGVNLGLALPGRFPAEFPGERALYDEWLGLIGAMHANAVRVYTVLPPVFYEALRDYNLAHPDRPLYLLQGVWTELPADHDYRGDFMAGFLAESYRVLDLVHGNAVIAPRRGHASGSYRADVSPWLLGLILGREWEPFSVGAFSALPDAPRSFRGEHFELEAGTPMEAWLAEVMDRLAAYALERYNLQTPLAFTNWPTLDPLRHPTESTLQEELVLRGARGEPVPELAPLFYNDDEFSLDARKIRAREGYVAGHFASYHVYPYHPDFLLLDPDYNLHPRSSYLAYLEDLKAHHGDQAVLIAEFGVPSSRGVARLHPRGYHHGAHSERAQGEVNALLWKEIRDSGMAGGVVFAWLDEWFKRNWLYDALERPEEHIPRWHSVMNPEQNYGLVAFDGVGEWPLREEGAPPWQGETPLLEADGAALYAQATPRYLQIAVSGLPADSFLVALDLHPAPGDTALAVLGPAGGRLLLNAAYQLYLDREAGTPWVFLELNAEARPAPGAGWAPWITQTQRRRFARDGREFPRRLDEPGRLRPGEDPPGARDPLADYRLTADGLQLRLPWTLLGVSDPSVGYVFDGPSDNHKRALGDVGIRVLTGAALDGGSLDELVLDDLPLEDVVRGDMMLEDLVIGDSVIEALTRGEPDGTRLEARFRWPRWQEPRTEARLKPAYYALQELWGAEAAQELWAEEAKDRALGSEVPEGEGSEGEVPEGEGSGR